MTNQRPNIFKGRYQNKSITGQFYVNRPNQAISTELVNLDVTINGLQDIINELETSGLGIIELYDHDGGGMVEIIIFDGQIQRASGHLCTIFLLGLRSQQTINGACNKVIMFASQSPITLVTVRRPHHQRMNQVSEYTDSIQLSDRLVHLLQKNRRSPVWHAWSNILMPYQIFHTANMEF